MDVPEEKYRKIINQFRSPLLNLIEQNPINLRRPLEPIRNLKYIISKALLSDNYPYYSPIYQEYMEEIKNGMSDQQPQTRALAIRLGRALPFLHRIKLIEMFENEIVNVGVLKREKEGPVASYGYEVAADIAELLMSVFEVTSQSQDIYFDVNQRIITIFSRYLQSSLQGDRNGLRNACEVIRTIFCYIGYTTIRKDIPENKLIAKLINTFVPVVSFVNQQNPSSVISTGMSFNQPYERKTNNTRLLTLLTRSRELQARLRVRELYGFCCLASHFSRSDTQLLHILAKEVLEVAQNLSECDVLLDCFSCLAALVTQEQPYHYRNCLLKRWLAVLQQISFKKQYLQYYVLLLDLCSRESYQIPQRISYGLAIHCLELTRHLQQQYSRFLVYLRSCKIILSISRRACKTDPDSNLLLKMFQYDWFIDRINQDQDLFKSQFLVALLHHAIGSPHPPSSQHLLDLLDIAHRLIDWRCTYKEETHVPTLKFAFDMYLQTLGWACSLLEKGQGLQGVVEGLINRCNDPSIYFLFKFKLIAKLLQVSWYKENHKYLQSKLNFDFIENEIQVVMMPRNPKPIFSYEYSLTFDGEIQSRKELEYIKIIMELLTNIPKIHEAYAPQIDQIIVEYHRYLAELELREDANKQLINCLQTLEADSYIDQPQRHFLLAALPSSPYLHTLSYETNLEGQVLFSTTESLQSLQEVNVFGPMSPVQLSIRLHPHRSYASAYIHIKKNQWVQTQVELKLVVSSGIEKIQIPFASSILEIKVDRVGALHFEVWKGEENQMLLGSGSFKLKRRLQWMRADHLRIIDGIRVKAYFKEGEDVEGETYLSCFYGEPIIVQILKSRHQVVVGVPSKQIYIELKDTISTMVQQLSSGTAQLIEESL